MKKILSLILIIAVIFFLHGNKLSAQTVNASVFRHIVIITFKQDAPADSIKALDDIYERLSKDPSVKDFETGVNISTRDTGVIKHVYVTTFASKNNMDNYKNQLLYKELFKVSLNISDNVTVADYWAMK